MPVLLVLDVSGQSQTSAAIARGFATHDPAVRIAGVALNQVASPRHEALCREAIAALGLPVVGAVPRDPAMGLPERHLGLVQAREHAGLETFIERLADVMERALDLDAVLALAAPLAPEAGGPRCRRRASGSPSRTTRPSASSTPISRRSGGRRGGTGPVLTPG